MYNKDTFNQEHLLRIQSSQNLSDFVHDAIREAIISGRLAPGLKLKQLELANQLDVSQQTVREALKRLVNSGLVVQTPNKGFAVTEIPLEEQDEIYGIRTALEVYAIEQAINNLSAEDLARMHELIPLSVRADGHRRPTQAVREANLEFHMILARATKNRHLIRILEQVWDLTWTYFHKDDSERVKESTASDLEEHTEILNALKKRDLEGARDAMKRHLLNTRRDMLTIKGAAADRETKSG